MARIARGLRDPALADVALQRARAIYDARSLGDFARAIDALRSASVRRHMPL